MSKRFLQCPECGEKIFESDEKCMDCGADLARYRREAEAEWAEADRIASAAAEEAPHQEEDLIAKAADDARIEAGESQGGNAMNAKLNLPVLLTLVVGLGIIVLLFALPGGETAPPANTQAAPAPAATAAPARPAAPTQARPASPPARGGSQGDLSAAVARVNQAAQGYFRITSWDQSVMEVHLADDFSQGELYKTTYDLTKMYRGHWGGNCTVWVYRRGVKVAEGQTRAGEINVTQLGW
jgi:hypothetical protein